MSQCRTVTLTYTFTYVLLIYVTYVLLTYIYLHIFGYTHPDLVAPQDFGRKRDEKPNLLPSEAVLEENDTQTPKL